MYISSTPVHLEACSLEARCYAFLALNSRFPDSWQDKRLDFKPYPSRSQRTRGRRPERAAGTVAFILLYLVSVDQRLVFEPLT